MYPRPTPVRNAHNPRVPTFQLDVSNVGEVTVWEFSGQETYFPVYHHFLFAHAQCLTCVLFSLEESFAIQLQQVCFWVNFLVARQHADLERGELKLVFLRFGKCY